MFKVNIMSIRNAIKGVNEMQTYNSLSSLQLAETLKHKHNGINIMFISKQKSINKSQTKKDT